MYVCYVFLIKVEKLKVESQKSVRYGHCYFSVYFITVALRHLETTSPSDEVREKAAGALWILESRDQLPFSPEPVKKKRKMEVKPGL